MSQDRPRLLDLWQPPAHAGRPIGCLATTFTFEPDFVEEDCLSRFLAMDSNPEEEDVAYLIEREEKLAETRVTVLVDRAHAQGAKSPRWDVLAVRPRRGIFHPKVALLHWDRHLRLLVSSANLTAGSYRRNLECLAAFDFQPGQPAASEVLEAAFEFLSSVLRLAPGDPNAPGPLARAHATLETARAAVAAMDLRPLPRDAAEPLPLFSLGEGDLLEAILREAWRGRRPSQATILSPFFDDSGQLDAPTRALSLGLGYGRGVRLTFLVQALEDDAGQQIIQAPRQLLTSATDRVAVRLRAIKPDEEEQELRRLHAKALWLEDPGREQALCVVGSSNFTSAGLGLNGGGNVEANVAFRLRTNRTDGWTARKVIPESAALWVDGRAARWEPDDTQGELEDRPALPFGFREALLHPARRELELGFGERLPGEWAVALPGGSRLIDEGEWYARGRPRSVKLAVPEQTELTELEVTWRDGRGRLLMAHWVVNVSAPEELPPPLKLRDLPLEALERVLTSRLPLHRALAQWLDRKDARASQPPDELDPLKRHNPETFLSRARRLSNTLEGLTARLERPTYSLESLEWRLHGPLSPASLAASLAREFGESGQARFMIAELLLTLSRVRWAECASVTVDAVSVEACRRECVRRVREILEGIPPANDPRLEAYIGQAVERAAS